MLVIPVQINGKVRTRLTLAPDADQASVEAAAKADGGVQKWLEGKTIRKIIVIPGKLVNIAVS